MKTNEDMQARYEPKAKRIAENVIQELVPGGDIKDEVEFAEAMMTLAYLSAIVATNFLKQGAKGGLHSAYGAALAKKTMATVFDRYAADMIIAEAEEKGL